MLPESLDEEVDGLRSYESFLGSWQRLNATRVDVVTLEGELLQCEIVDGGWALSTGEEFPTVEALLQRVSPKFRSLWDDELYKRLEVVKESQDRST